ncbi:hypothetical protein H5410_011939 [Solanum commersonii]|uniref:Uncharacterized protein n=1 Tax=Solanum commersonii TaxID=4109 RepID=A0A9J6AQZ1_SOLCO|nr:hypothetical protein H5410_011939 [Solanum commersonii]
MQVQYFAYFGTCRTCESHASKIRSQNTSSVPSICLDTLGFLHTREKPSLRMLAVYHPRSLPPPPDLRRKTFRNTSFVEIRELKNQTSVII